MPPSGAARIDAAKARSLLADAAAHAAATGHPRLWRAVADAALGAGELKAAERAYVQCSDYIVSRALCYCSGSLQMQIWKLCKAYLIPMHVLCNHFHLLISIKQQYCTKHRGFRACHLKGI